MKKVAVILSGCGVFDGAEIHEAVLTLLHIELNGASYQCFAPNISQHHVVNHITGEEMSEQRNVLIEAARIARGDIKDLNELNVQDFDALALPGGFGAAKNLCDFAFKGAECDINNDVANACRAFADAQKPAAYICIAPALIPQIYAKGTLATIGNDQDTAAAVATLGATHQNCDVADIVIDEKARVISTPAYMLATNISEAASGIEKAIAKLIKMS